METDGRPRSWIRFVPNLLSGVRLILALVFPVLPGEWPWRLSAVVLAGLTDGLDGLIARHFRITSIVGGLLDGIADKLFALVVLITLAVDGRILWWQVLLLLSRDVVVAIAASYAVATAQWKAFDEMPPRLPGKLTTMAVFAWLVMKLTPWTEGVSVILLVVAVLCSLVAAGDYLVLFVRGVREHPRRDENPAAGRGPTRGPRAR